MGSSTSNFEKAIALFDSYNANDPNLEQYIGGTIPKEVLYAQHMTKRLLQFAPEASERVQLAARCQHIGRWEIPRSAYPMDKKGYFQWRNEEKLHHAKIAGEILASCHYEADTINGVKSLVLKKELRSNPETQLLEDVVCLVFIEYYLEDFASRHDGEKVIDIIRKTAVKMSRTAIDAVGGLSISHKMQSLIHQALTPSLLFRFEEEFMGDDIRCIPMVIRYKLDSCGIKLKLSEWNQLTPSERDQLLQFPTPHKEALANYRNLVQKAVTVHTGDMPMGIVVEEQPAWMMREQIPPALVEKLEEFNRVLSLSDWRGLTNLQRFVLLKLSRPNHANKNFPKAMKEFGL